jgi:hypothetical protein
MPPIEIANLFRKSEFFYCYENSSLALEARLCGCPVVLLPNPFFDKVIGGDDLGMEGIAWGNTPEQVKWAQETVHLAYDKYKSNIDLFWNQLDVFIHDTQALAKKTTYSRKVNFKKELAGLDELGIYRQETPLYLRILRSLIHDSKKEGLTYVIAESLKLVTQPKKLKSFIGKAERNYFEERLNMGERHLLGK